MGRGPDLGQPEDVWYRIPEELQVEIQEHVRVGADGFRFVVGWENAAAVVGLTVRSLQRRVKKGRLPKFRDEECGPRGCQVSWPLWMLWHYREWREKRHECPGWRP